MHRCRSVWCYSAGASAMRRERRCLPLFLFFTLASIGASFLLPSSEIRTTTTSIMSSKLPRVDFDSTETIGSTRWMRLETLTYHVADDKSESGSAVRKWDRAVRTTKQSEDSIDAVVILAILRHDVNDISRDEIVCGKSRFCLPII